MTETSLVTLFNSVLGKGTPTRKGNHIYKCPFCNHYKPKLEIFLGTSEDNKHPYRCWVCKVRGNNLVKLLKDVKAPESKIEHLKQLVKYQFDTPGVYIKKPQKIALPAEFKPLGSGYVETLEGNQAKKYLYERGITGVDIQRYSIGYCETGRYSQSIIIPSYDQSSELNYFVSRTYVDAFKKYQLPPDCSKDIVALESNINWDLPVILCEGMFDAITIRRNAIPLLGTDIQKNLLQKLLLERVKQVIIALDNDAIAKALTHCRTLLNYGKEVFLVDLQAKDPSELGFKQFTQQLHQMQPLNFKSLMQTYLNQ
jgi:DNA primase